MFNNIMRTVLVVGGGLISAVVIDMLMPNKNTPELPETEPEVIDIQQD